MSSIIMTPIYALRFIDAVYTLASVQHLTADTGESPV
jgi:hypothetical protein